MEIRFEFAEKKKKILNHASDERWPFFICLVIIIEYHSKKIVVSCFEISFLLLVLILLLTPLVCTFYFLGF